MEGVNIAASVVLAVAGPIIWKRTGRWMGLFVGGTGVAWLLHFIIGALLARDMMAKGGVEEQAGRLLFTFALAAASTALVFTTMNHTGARHARLAGGVGIITALALFIGRGTPDLDGSGLARLARDAGLGAFVFALVLYAQPQGSRHPAWASIALLLYPGIVAGIYLHPASHRNMLGLALALVFVAVLWLRNTNTFDREASRRALIVSLSCFALPLLAMAAVRWQGGIDAAAEGPLRALARTGGPILYAFADVWSRQPGSADASGKGSLARTPSGGCPHPDTFRRPKR